MEETIDNQRKNKGYDNLVMWKKGQSGNPAGRPKGKTMKEYARELLECQSEEERQEFLHGLPKEVIWKMAEGNPATNLDHSTMGKELPQPIINVHNYHSDRKDTETKQEN